MKIETFEEFRAWLKNNTPRVGERYSVQTADRNGFYNEDAEDFAKWNAWEVCRTFRDYITVTRFDSILWDVESDSIRGDVERVAHFTNGGEAPFKVNKYGNDPYTDDEEDY